MMQVGLNIIEIRKEASKQELELIEVLEQCQTIILKR